MSWIHGLGYRLRELLRPDSADEELADELRDHLDRETERQTLRGVASEDRRARPSARGTRSTSRARMPPTIAPATCSAIRAGSALRRAHDSPQPRLFRGSHPLAGPRRRRHDRHLQRRQRRAAAAVAISAVRGAYRARSGGVISPPCSRWRTSPRSNGDEPGRRRGRSLLLSRQRIRGAGRDGAEVLQGCSSPASSRTCCRCPVRRSRLLRRDEGVPGAHRRETSGSAGSPGAATRSADADARREAVHRRE